MFTVDENGILRAELEEGDAIVGWFLEQDIQSSSNGCKEYIRSLDLVANGSEQRWEATGNAFMVTAHRDVTLIESIFSDDSKSISTEKLISYLKSWLEHIEAEGRK